MTYDLSSFDWKVLRILTRAGSKPVPGATLRHTPTRVTSSGAFLTRLVAAGLVEVVGLPGEGWKDTLYRLTALGRHAAEYGEYEAPAPWEVR